MKASVPPRGEDPIAKAIVNVARLGEAAAEEGAKHGTELLNHPASSWRRLMRSDPRYRSYGTLEFLLAKAREKFQSEPTVAHQLTSAVRAFTDSVNGPSKHHEVGLRGLARKEHANACQWIGDLRAALRAAERAIEIYGELPTLEFEQARARLVASNILREMGKTNKALALARQCDAVFLAYRDQQFLSMARMCEGMVLFSLKQFEPALTIFTDLMEEAERERDKITLARCLQNAAECARELGDHESARRMYPRALVYFEELNLLSETNRVRWCYALSLSSETKRVPHAISELYKVRAIYLDLGMNSHATSAALDIVRIRFERGEDVRDECTELVRMFTDAGMMQNAVEALAYLREEARRDRLTTKTITHVRTYFVELSRKPTLLFVRPRRGEEG